VQTAFFEKLMHQYDIAVRRIGKLFFKIRVSFTNNKRPSSYPFVSGDSFRALADHIHEEGHSCNPALIKTGDVVFVSQGTLLEYLKSIHQIITTQYILICHNGDASVDQEIVNFIDEKIFHFFAQDVTVGHERITPIPIGLENLHYYIAGVVPFFKRLRSQIETKPPRRKNRIFFSFSVSTNPQERGPARDYFLKHPSMDTSTRFMTPRRHARLLTTYKFVASPPGNAIESCRTWEALYLKTIPVVKKFTAMEYFVSIGLPLWIVDDWHELERMSESDLERKYETFIKNANWEPLYMDYWIQKINIQKKLCKQSTH